MRWMQSPRAMAPVQQSCVRTRVESTGLNLRSPGCGLLGRRDCHWLCRTRRSRRRGCRCPGRGPPRRPRSNRGPDKRRRTRRRAEKPAPQPSACRLALTEDIAIAPTLPPITGPGACGGDDIVRLEAVVLPDRKPCAAEARGDAALPDGGGGRRMGARRCRRRSPGRTNTSVSELDNFDSFDCRGRNRVVGARMSEHGRANALDVRGVKFANGQFVSFTDRARRARTA